MEEMVKSEKEEKKVKLLDLSFYITSFITLFPMFFGLIIWNHLPDIMPVHFGIDGNPDNYGAKGINVILLPLILLFVNIIEHLAFNYKMAQQESQKKIKLVYVVKWIAPVLSMVLGFSIYAYSFGMKIDISVIAQLLIGFLVVITGNYIPKVEPWMFNVPVNEKVLPRAKRVFAYGYVATGLFIIFTSFFSWGVYAFLSTIPLLAAFPIIFAVMNQKK